MNSLAQHPETPDRTVLTTLLELGLILVVVVGPLPFGSVGPRGRLGLELAALVLGLLWLLRGWIRTTVLPPRAFLLGALTLLGVALFQITPLPEAVIARISPKTLDVREITTLTEEAAEAETRLLGFDPRDQRLAARISVDPGATASALRTGIALFVFVLVATAVAAVRGARRLALALLLGAAFQGLYGLLVLASGHDRIWNIPKKVGLDSATGTYVNRNHFACLLAISLACGLALILRNLHGSGAKGLRSRFVELFSAQGSRTLFLGILLTLGLAGLLASLSRAGIALGLAALTLTLIAGGRRQGLRSRLVIGMLIAALALVPLAQFGVERLTNRLGDSATELTNEGGRATVLRDTLRMATAFPLVGSGFGSFSALYPLFRSPEVRKFYSHTHNDAAQLLAEAGLAGGIGLLLLLAPLARCVVECLGRAKGTLGVGFAAGLAAFLVHSLIDFNVHIPANAATAAILAGTLMGLPWRSRR